MSGGQETAIDRAYRNVESAEIQLMAALERHRYAAERARNLLGPDMGLEGSLGPASPQGEARHYELGLAGAGVLAARRELSMARSELRATRAMLRQERP